MVDELQGSHFFRGLLYSFAQFGVLSVLSMISSNRAAGVFTESERHVHSCGSSFEDSKGSDDRRRHSVLGLIDFKVLQRPAEHLLAEVQA